MVYKELKPRAKIEFIWDYYKFPIIATLFTIIMVVWITVTVWENKHRIYALDVTIIGNQVNSNLALSLQEELQAMFIEKGIIGEVLVDPINLTSGSPDEQLASNARFFAKTSSKTADLFISLDSDYVGFAESGLFAPLDELFASGDIEVDEDLIIKNTLIDTGIESIYGINVTSSPKLTGLTDEENGLILSIYVNSTKKDNIIEAIKYLIE